MVKINQVRFVNCQSLKDVTYDLSEGLNVIVAPNNTGKSVFFKMLTESVCPGFIPKEDRQELISYDCESANVTYKFSDGSEGRVSVFEKRTVYYYTQDSDNEEFEALLEPDPEMVSKLGLIVDAVNRYIANLLNLDQSLLLVNSDTKANDNLIGMLTRHDQLNLLIDNTADKLEFHKNRRRKISELVMELEHNMRRYSKIDTDDLEKRIGVMEAGIDIYDTLLEGVAAIQPAELSSLDNKDYGLLLELLELYEVGKDLLVNGSSLSEGDINQDLLNMLGIHEQLGTGYDFAKEIPYINDLSDINKSLQIADMYDILQDGFWKTQDIPFREESVEIILSLQLLEIGDNLRLIEADDWQEDLLAQADLYSMLLDGHSQLNIIAESVETYSKLDVEIAEMWEEINAVGRVVPCVIHGEVTYINGECIPISNGQTRLAN